MMMMMMMKGLTLIFNVYIFLIFWLLALVLTIIDNLYSPLPVCLYYTPQTT